MTGLTLLMLCAGVIGLMVALTWAIETIGPGERRAYPMVERRGRDFTVAGLAIAVITVLFVFVATFPQGTP